MTTGDPKHARPIASAEELARTFAAADKPRAAWRVGAEYERIGAIAATGMPVPFEGPGGIEALLGRLADRGGWTRIDEGGRVIALGRGEEKVTLEPGGQLELSTAPHADVAELAREVRAHLAALRAESAPAGVEWLGLGFRPFGALDDVPWVPKGRYAVMREILPPRGRLAHEMMKRTATVQANLDWSDEEDAAKKLAAAMSVTSIVTALFANSPIAEGADTGWASFRARAWLETDPDRCGILPFAFTPGPIFARYAEWALDVPMFFVQRDDRYRPAGGLTFRRFLREGFQGERATLPDWELHLSTLFPEARLKGYLEVRGADSGPADVALALPALWQGLLYDEAACAAATRLTAHLGFAERVALREAVPRAGLAARVGAAGTTTVLPLARELVAIARDGLGRAAPAALPALAPLERIVAEGRAPAERVRDAFRAARGDPAAFVAALRD